MKAAILMAEFYDGEDEIIARLVSEGFDVFRAELLMVFVPLGLARPLITRLSADPPVQLSETAVIMDFANDRMLTVNLADVPEFVAALCIGEEYFQTGIIPREQFSVAISSSVELILINKSLEAGTIIDGAEMAPPHLLRLAKTPGFEDWYQAIKPKE